MSPILHAAGSDISSSGPPRPPASCEVAAGVWGYVANDRRAIENCAIVPLASSGPMEKAVDMVVARRFKARGVSWFRRGMSALVRLRILRLNRTWDRYWSGRFAAALQPGRAPPEGRAQK